MVNLTEVSKTNDAFAAERHRGLVCVFAGATSGTGAGTLEAMAKIVFESTFYVLGRSAAHFATQREKLQSLNPTCTVIFLEAEISLLSDVDAACKQIAAAEGRVDYLYMSCGLISLNGPQYTKEGLEVCFSLSYYARMRLTTNLLPLLRASEQPRVLSVLNAGREQRMRDDDLGLEKHWSAMAVIGHSTTMTSLALEYLAAHDSKIAFLHAFPGWVRTDNFSRLRAPDGSAIFWRVALRLIQGLVAVVQKVFGISAEDCGARQAFHLTSGRFAGPGLLLIDRASDILPRSKVLEHYRTMAGPEKVWEHTAGVFEKALTRGGSKGTDRG